MDILKSYWRMEYVAAPKEKGKGHANPFVDLPKLGDDRAALIVHRGQWHYAVLNRYPYNPGHVLIVPYRQVAELAELNPEERLEMMDLIVWAQDLIKRAMRPDAFNVGFNLGQPGGAGIPSHLHGHVVPRWSGDVNFLTVIGETRSLPQALDETWQCLRDHMDASSS